MLSLRKKTRGPKICGFTLIEILVSLVLFAIGIAFASRIFVSARYFIKEAENKSKAMKIASLQMEKYLAYSYSGLEDLINSGASSISAVDSTDSNFTYTVTLTKLNEVGPSVTVPYIRVQVVCNYTEENAAGTTPTSKYVRLRNIVPYPYFHIKTKKIEFTTAGTEPVATYSGSELFFIPGAEITFNYSVKKDLLIFYNIGIEGQTGTGIGGTDTITTQCFIDAAGQNIQTVTPILTQTFINNSVGVSGIPANTNHTISVEWRKDQPGGTVRLKWINIVVVFVEPAA